MYLWRFFSSRGNELSNKIIVKKISYFQENLILSKIIKVRVFCHKERRRTRAVVNKVQFLNLLISPWRMIFCSVHNVTLNISLGIVCFPYITELVTFAYCVCIFERLDISCYSLLHYWEHRIIILYCNETWGNSILIIIMLCVNRLYQ